MTAKERERGGFGGRDGGGFDDEKFSGNWRREGPLPPTEPRRGGGGSGFGFKDRAGPGAEGDEGPRRGSRFEPVEERPELNTDWRASVRGPLPPPDRPERGEGKRGFGSGFETSGAADAEETWSKGAKFRPSPPASERGSVGRKFGAGLDKNTPPSVADEGDWRSKRPGPVGRSPSSSTPPTPQLARKKLELLPRSGQVSNAGTPLASPSPTSAGPSASKANPFGAAR